MMSLVYSDPQTIVVNNDWIRANVSKFSYEALTCDLEDIVSEWAYDDFIIRVVNIGDYILWVATCDMEPVGAGSFTCCSDVIKEGIQAVLPRFQKRGIYSSVIQFLIEEYEPFDITNDHQQTIEMQRLWSKLTANQETSCIA